jgi:hypothetical protein
LNCAIDSSSFEWWLPPKLKCSNFRKNLTSDFKKPSVVAKFHPSTINISLHKHNIITQPNPLFDIFIKKHFAMKKNSTFMLFHFVHLLAYNGYRWLSSRIQTGIITGAPSKPIAFQNAQPIIKSKNLH